MLLSYITEIPLAPAIIIGFYILGGIFAIIAITYFIFKRIKDVKKETFEKRDN